MNDRKLRQLITSINIEIDLLDIEDINSYLKDKNLDDETLKKVKEGIAYAS